MTTAPSGQRSCYATEAYVGLLLQYTLLQLPRLIICLYGVYSCDESDSLTVVVKLKEGPRELGTYCGSKFPPSLMSTNHRLDVLFVSRLRPAVTSSSQPRGFNVTYSFVTSMFWRFSFAKAITIYYVFHYT